MSDTEILDWIERHATAIVLSSGGSGLVVTWLHRGKERQTAGRDLRDAVRHAMEEMGR